MRYLTRTECTNCKNLIKLSVRHCTVFKEAEAKCKGYEKAVGKVYVVCEKCKGSGDGIDSMSRTTLKSEADQ